MASLSWATLGILSCFVLSAQQQVLTFHSDVDSSDQPYAIYVPQNFDRAHTYPLVIDLHMEDMSHALALKMFLGRNPDPDFLPRAAAVW